MRGKLSEVGGIISALMSIKTVSDRRIVIPRPIYTNKETDQNGNEKYT